MRILDEDTKVFFFFSSSPLGYMYHIQVSSVHITSGVLCGYPPVYDDVDVEGSEFFPGGDVFISCAEEDGFSFNESVTCLENGQWDMDPFTCDPRSKTVIRQKSCFIIVYLFFCVVR